MLKNLYKLSTGRSKNVKFISYKLYSSTAVEQYYDLVICGGGLVGGAMATALANSKKFEDKKVLMLDQVQEPKSIDAIPEEYGMRVIALAPGSMELLKSVKAWDMIERKCEAKKMQVWETCSDSLITFDKDNMNETLCYIVENSLITNALLQCLKSETNKNVDLMFNSKIKNCKFPLNYERLPNDPLPLSKLELDDGTCINTQLVIGADGARSFISDKAKFKKFNVDYDQAAIVATLEFNEPCENIVAWQRFLTTGAIALLPLNDNQSSLVWSTTKSEAKRLMSLEELDFVSEVNDAFNRPGKNSQADLIKSVKGMIFPNDITSFQLPPAIKCISYGKGSRASFPLGMSHSNHYVKPRVVLIGDSAHRVHPLAGQGANLGFGDVTSLLKTLETAVYEGRDLGTLQHLLNYETDRQRHNASVMATIHGLNTLYSTEFSPIVYLRSLGLSVANNTKFVKDILMAGAMR